MPPEPTPETEEPTTTTVVGYARWRSWTNQDTFVDITGPGVGFEREPLGDGVLRLTFDAVLTEEQRVAVWERLTARNETDAAERAAVRADVAAAVAWDGSAAEAGEQVERLTAALERVAAYALDVIP